MVYLLTILSNLQSQLGCSMLLLQVSGNVGDAGDASDAGGGLRMLMKMATLIRSSWPNNGWRLVPATVESL